MVKQESLKLTDETLTKKIIDEINQVIPDLMTSLFKDDKLTKKITSLKIDFQTNSVYVVYNDYSEEKKKMSEILKESMKINSELQQCFKQYNEEISKKQPDTSLLLQLQVKISSLQNQLSELDSQYYELSKIVGTPIHIYDLL